MAVLRSAASLSFSGRLLLGSALSSEHHASGCPLNKASEGGRANGPNG